MINITALLLPAVMQVLPAVMQVNRAGLKCDICESGISKKWNFERHINLRPSTHVQFPKLKHAQTNQSENGQSLDSKDKHFK